MGIINDIVPNQSKRFNEGKTPLVSYCTCEMQGWRSYMEDEVMINISNHHAVLGVFDGHGGKGFIYEGSQVSSFCAKYFYKVLSSLRSFKNGHIEHALIETFLKLDEILKLNNVNAFLINNACGDRRKQHVRETLEFLNFRQVNTRENRFYREIDKFYHNFNKNSISYQAFECEIPEKVSPDSDNYLEINDNMTSHSSSQIENFSEQEQKLENLELTDKVEKYSNLINAESSENNEDQSEQDLYSFGGLSLVTKNQSELKELCAYNIGSTANVALIKQGFIYIANVGDSMAVLYKSGKAIKLNLEHKISLPCEAERIKKSGSVIVNNRIDGRLNLTRALGDFFFKSKKWKKPYEQPVIAYPEIHKFKITEDMEFILIATDGVWDCVDYQKLCKNVSEKLKKGFNKKRILNEVFDKIISKDENGTININFKSHWDRITCLAY